MVTLGLLPIVSLMLLFILGLRNETGLRETFVGALLVWGTIIVLSTEGLSLFSLITASSLTIFWIVLTVGLFVTILCSKIDLKDKTARVWTVLLREKGLVAGILGILSITLLIAVIAPPNNWDSMAYHMSRVANWIQNGNVRHYQTDIARQLFSPPFAEFTILHLTLLSGSDRLANSVQWLSMIGCIIAVSLIARELGANYLGQILAAVFTVTIPMGILQSTSTQTDYVTSMWVSIFVFSLIKWHKDSSFGNCARSGVALGLAIITKYTTVFYLTPFILWFGVIIGLKVERLKLVRAVVVVLTTIAILNLGHLYRNYAEFGRVLGPDQRIHIQKNAWLGIDVTLSNLVRNTVQHIGMSSISYKARKGVEFGVRKLHDFIGIGVNDPSTNQGEYRFRIRGLSSHEDYSGNPLHFFLIVFSIPLIVLHPKLRGNRMLLFYIVMIFLGIIFFCTVLSWTPWRVRLHLPFFVLMAAPFGVCCGLLLSGRNMKVLASSLFIFSIPWLISNNLKPLYPLVRFSKQTSIVYSSRVHMYFANRPELETQYLQAVNVLRSTHCREIGMISYSGDEWEYPLWVLLNRRDERGSRVQPGVLLTNARNGSLDSFCAFVLLGDKTRQIQGMDGNNILYQSDDIAVVKNLL